MLKAHWDDASIMMSPIVLQLDNDDCDGEVTARDIPEILFVSFPNTTSDPGVATYNAGHATLHAISLVDGELVDKWSYSSTTDPLKGSTEAAGGNFDGRPGNEVVACTATGKLQAVDAAGDPLWTADPSGCRVPSIGDVDGDGQPEILTETDLVDGATGAIEASFPSTRKALADLDGDGQLDVVGPGAATLGRAARGSAKPSRPASSRPPSRRRSRCRSTSYRTTRSTPSPTTAAPRTPGRSAAPTTTPASPRRPSVRDRTDPPRASQPAIFLRGRYWGIA